MINVTTTVDDSGAIKMLEIFADKVNDLNPIMEDVGKRMITSITRNFQAQGRPSPWAGLSEKTLAKRRKGKGKRSPMILAGDTGMLRSTIAAESFPGGVSIGSPMEYAPYIQKGTRHMPARPFVLFQPEDIVGIKKDVNDYISKVFGAQS